MSRSPVRTALRMLQTDGLIVTDYYKSMTVKEITEEDINQIYQLRELIELPAFKLIFDSGKYEEFSYRIEEKVVRMCAAASDPFAWEIADIAFHMEIVSIYENERIDRFIIIICRSLLVWVCIQSRMAWRSSRRMTI